MFGVFCGKIWQVISFPKRPTSPVVTLSIAYVPPSYISVVRKFRNRGFVVHTTSIPEAPRRRRHDHEVVVAKKFSPSSKQLNTPLWKHTYTLVDNSKPLCPRCYGKHATTTKWSWQKTCSPSSKKMNTPLWKCRYTLVANWKSLRPRCKTNLPPPCNTIWCPCVKKNWYPHVQKKLVPPCTKKMGTPMYNKNGDPHVQKNWYPLLQKKVPSSQNNLNPHFK